MSAHKLPLYKGFKYLKNILEQKRSTFYSERTSEGVCKFRETADKEKTFLSCTFYHHQYLTSYLILEVDQKVSWKYSDMAMPMETLRTHIKVPSRSHPTTTLLGILDFRNNGSFSESVFSRRKVKSNFPQFSSIHCYDQPFF